MFSGGAKAHRKIFERRIDADGEDVLVYQPKAPTAGSTAADKVLGHRPANIDDSLGPSKIIRAVIGADVLTGSDPTSTFVQLVSALGGLDKVNALLQAKLGDTLVDTSKKLGLTVFHTAKFVVWQGERYEVTGVKRGGLPSPDGPYILWVGLRKAGA